ncbi:hypothetical protein B4U37_14350 [Sutcliffiella horikoshii]|uniref:Uncharacterized protein n=1 Tax=Sutcliffiella horikoshii TaxID=79883 RepID=A0ABM6KL11_9BACI|nr:hypothetical protein [Sutcliffiella horikoshii]ART77156.1 hypothetical protein B4U37_14350 [Sutcliffiella horikoshii]
MRMKMISVLLLITFVTMGCGNNNLDLEGATRIEIYDWENKDLIHTIEDASFIEGLVTKLNKANGEKISDTADIAMLPYKVHLTNKEDTVLVLGFDQTEDESHFMDYENSIRYIVDITLPNVPLTTATPKTKEEIEEENKKELELKKQNQEEQKNNE